MRRVISARGVRATRWAKYCNGPRLAATFARLRSSPSCKQHERDRTPSVAAQHNTRSRALRHVQHTDSFLGFFERAAFNLDLESKPAKFARLLDCVCNGSCTRAAATTRVSRCNGALLSAWAFAVRTRGRGTFAPTGGTGSYLPVLLRGAAAAGPASPVLRALLSGSHAPT